MSDIQLFPLRFHDKWILIDKNAQIHPLDVEPVLIKEAGEGTFFIETGTGMGLVDSGLNWLIHPDVALQEKSMIFPAINGGLLGKYATFFENGLSVAQDGNYKYGFIDKKGNWVIKPQYDNAVHFSEGLASVMKDGKWGAVDIQGNTVIDFLYGGQFFFRDGTATVYRKESRYYGGLIDRSGKMLVDEQFLDNRGLSEGLMPAGKTKKYGYYDLSGKAVFSEIFERAGLFQNGKAVVSFNGKYGMIDKEGNFIIQPVFEYIGNFYKGIAMAQVKNKYGFINESGKFVITPVFDQVESFGANGLAKVLVSKLFKAPPTVNVAIHFYFYHYINRDGKFVHPEKPDFDIISVEQWEQENPEAREILAVKVMDDLSEYLYLNETKINQETEKVVNETEQYNKTVETELRPLTFNDLLKVPYFVVNLVSALWFGFKCSIYSPIEYPLVWHRFIFLGIFAIFGYFSGKTFAEYQYIEGNNFSWKNREGYFSGFLLLTMGLSYFFNITNYFEALFTLLDFVFLLAFFITTGMTLGNIFRRMTAELMPSNQKGLQLVVGLLFIISLLNAIAFSSDIYTPHGVLGISALIAVPAGIIWIFLSNRKPEHEGATSLWNAFYFGSNSASFTTRSFYKKHYTERQFKEWDEKNTTYTFDGDERSIAASRGGVGVVCIFFTNLVALSSPWFLTFLIKKIFYFY